MTFLVLGHLCFDVIHPVEGPDVESYGGIYYAVAALASLCKASDEIRPVFGVHKADHAALLEDLKQFPNVDTAGIYKIDEPTNRVHLYYKDRQNRIECSKDIARPIPYEKIQRHLSADGILINMISGFDLTIDVLDAIRLAVRSHDVPIHFDYHSLTLGVKPDHERFRRPLDDWRRWAFMIDAVQLNEDEIAGLALGGLTEQQTAGHLLTLSVKGVVVTRGDRGASLYYNEHKKILRKDYEGIQPGNPRDATGCGDVFGAAFLLQYAKSRDLFAATDFANRVAAAKVQQIGVGELKNLRDALVAR